MATQRGFLASVSPDGQLPSPLLCTRRNARFGRGEELGSQDSGGVGVGQGAGGGAGAADLKPHQCGHRARSLHPVTIRESRFHCLVDHRETRNQRQYAALARRPRVAGGRCVGLWPDGLQTRGSERSSSSGSSDAGLCLSSPPISPVLHLLCVSVGIGIFGSHIQASQAPGLW